MSEAPENPTAEITPEQLREVLHTRFGTDEVAPFSAINPTILRQLQHRSVRRFSDRPVTDDELTAVLTAAQAASNSSNHNSWSVVVVRDQAHKTELKPLIGDQPFIDKAPVLLFWVADLYRAHRLAERAERPTVGTGLFEATLVSFIDASLAAQNAAVAAESLGLGITYIGGARNHPLETAASLGLPPHTAVVFGMTLGWPSPTDRSGVRPRPPQRLIVHHERYDTDVLGDLDAYDRTINDFFASYGRNFDWIDYVTSHFSSEADFYGREHLLEQIRDLGFPSR